jgi:deoxyribodipyrimidine photo-lyase
VGTLDAPHRPGWSLSGVHAVLEELPVAAPTHLVAPSSAPAGLALEELGLRPSLSWTDGIDAAWRYGEAGARAELEGFLERAARRYDVERDLPALPSTSRMSPYLHSGEIGPRQIWHRVRRWMLDCDDPQADRAAEAFLRELAWREFAHHVLFHFPATVEQPLRPEFSDFPWLEDEAAERAWRKGRTGYPLVDAGMRELWATGWMHNRVRMVVASFLTKDLLIPWQRGAAWFRETLVDADLANNTMGWQWTAGCGADAAPYFRVFNPVSQSQKFDGAGDYIRRWVPELARLDARCIHEPAKADEAVLRRAGVVLDDNYPRPVVEHSMARVRALAAYQRLTKSDDGTSPAPRRRGART